MFIVHVFFLVFGGFGSRFFREFSWVVVCFRGFCLCGFSEFFSKEFSEFFLYFCFCGDRNPERFLSAVYTVVLRAEGASVVSVLTRVIFGGCFIHVMMIMLSHC